MMGTRNDIRQKRRIVHMVVSVLTFTPIPLLGFVPLPQAWPGLTMKEHRRDTGVHWEKRSGYWKSRDLGLLPPGLNTLRPEFPEFWHTSYFPMTYKEKL